MFCLPIAVKFRFFTPSMQNLTVFLLSFTVKFNNILAMLVVYTTGVMNHEKAVSLVTGKV